MILVPSLLMKLSFESHETKVVCATIRDKKEREQTVGRRGHKAKGVSYVIFTDDGQEYSVSSEVYAEAEVGGTYYLGTMDGWKTALPSTMLANTSTISDGDLAPEMHFCDA